jgi:DNA-binding transcriptional ArsR family regulator
VPDPPDPSPTPAAPPSPVSLSSAAESSALSAELLQDLAGTFGLLSATVRLQLVLLLAEAERDVGSLAEQVGQSVPTVSHHLTKLKLAGLVRARRAGKHQIYAMRDPLVVEIARLAVRHHQPASPHRRTRLA